MRAAGQSQELTHRLEIDSGEAYFSLDRCVVVPLVKAGRYLYMFDPVELIGRCIVGAHSMAKPVPVEFLDYMADRHPLLCLTIPDSAALTRLNVYLVEVVALTVDPSNLARTRVLVCSDKVQRSLGDGRAEEVQEIVGMEGGCQNPYDTDVVPRWELYEQMNDLMLTLPKTVKDDKMKASAANHYENISDLAEQLSPTSIDLTIVDSGNTEHWMMAALLAEICCGRSPRVEETGERQGTSMDPCQEVESCLHYNMGV